MTSGRVVDMDHLGDASPPLLHVPPLGLQGWLHQSPSLSKTGNGCDNVQPIATETNPSKDEDEDDGSVVAPLRGVDSFAQSSSGAGPSVMLQSLAPVPGSKPPSRTDSYAVHVTSPWVYELLPSHEMPPIDLSKTPLRKWFPPILHDGIIQFLRIHYLKFALVYRIGTVCFFGLLFVHPGPLQIFFQAVVVVAIVPVLTTLALSSFDLFKMILHNHEFAFISVINLINWVLFAITLGFPLGFFTFSPWMALQTIIMVDLNYRTYPTALKSILASIPALIIVAVFSQVGTGATFHPVSIEINGRPLRGSDIISFTSSNLVIFLLKKHYLKRTTTHPYNPQIKVISCVVVRANVELVLTNHPDKVNARKIFSRVFTQRSGKKAAAKHSPMHSAEPPQPTRTMPHSSSVMSESARNELDVQQLRISRLKRSHVDATRTLSTRMKPTPFTSLRFATWKLVCFYIAGSTGFLACVASSIHELWFMQLPEAERKRKAWLFASFNASWTLAIAFVGSGLFCGTLFMAYQQELVHWLLHNFDFWFSAFQVVSLAGLVSDMMQWQPTCIVNLMWCVWFLWILSLDALTPVMKHRFAFTKRLATLPMLGILLGSIWIFTLLFFRKSNLVDRELWGFDLGGSHISFRSEPMMVGRIFTIIGWSTRLVWALAVRREDELMLIRGRVEYMSEYETFPVREAIEARRAAKLAKRKKQVVKATAADSSMSSNSKKAVGNGARVAADF